MATIPGTGLDLKAVVSSVGLPLQYVVYILLICVALGFITWLLYQKKVYFVTIQYYDNLGGKRYTEAGVDKARVVRLGLVDGEFLWAKRKKMYLPADGLKMGMNKYYFAKNDDGYWYNIILGDLDAKNGILDIEPTDRDMKATAYAIRKNTENRHAKKSNVDKFLQYGIPVILLLILCIGGWFMLKKTGEWSGQVTATANENLKIQAQISDTNKLIVSKLDQIISTSGIKTAPGG